jgi:glycosyltransferase involved in cell wall biosynthesis
MSKVSIIIPSRNEKYLLKTIQDIYQKATGDFEVLVAFDGPPYQVLPEKPNLIPFYFPETIGLKACINALTVMANGKYIYKTDSHCMFGKGFDEILQADMEDNWVVTPRFYVLDAENWRWQDERFYDYFYLSCPFTDPRGVRFKAGGHWPERTAERLAILLDETPQIHGSGWFVTKDYLMNYLGGFPRIDPLGHAQEPPYLCLKTWLGPWGGKVMVNKKTWYAHLHQQGNKRGYSMSKEQENLSYKIAVDFWLGNKWDQRIHDFDWFVDKFMPMPTWPDNWKELYQKWQQQ